MAFTFYACEQLFSQFMWYATLHRDHLKTFDALDSEEILFLRAGHWHGRGLQDKIATNGNLKIR